MNFLAAFPQQTASLGDPISTQLCLHSRLSPLFLESTCKTKEKKLWQYPAIFSSRLANNAYLLNYFKDAHNVVLFSVFIVLNLCRWKKKKKKTQRTDKFDPMRDKNDLKERLGQRWDKTLHSKSLILKFLSRQSEFTKMHIIQNFSEQKTSPGYTRQDYNKLFFDTCTIKAER